jgi:hypothetical protein
MPDYRKMRPVAGQCGPVRAAVRGGVLRRPEKALVAEQGGGGRRRTAGPLVVDNFITVVHAVVVLWSFVDDPEWLAVVRGRSNGLGHEFKNTEFRTTFRQSQSVIEGPVPDLGPDDIVYLGTY